MTKMKVSGHDEIPIEVFQQFWPTIGYDFHQMILRGIKNGAFYEGVTKGFISFIPKK